MSIELNITRCVDGRLHDIGTDVSIIDFSTIETVQKIRQKYIDGGRNKAGKNLLKLIKKYDGASFENIEEAIITEEQLKGSLNRLTPKDRKTLEQAYQRIKDYHKKSILESWSYTDEYGNRLGQQVTALESVGIYVPGGRANYPSTLLMTATPAGLAGVKDIAVATPATSLASVSPMVLAAAELTGVNRLLLAGGAQAIFALAYGMNNIFSSTHKIVGPGNKYVAAAKSLVASEGVVAIDMLAGPSEIIIYADETANPEWVAMDLFAQAEHDPDARAILISEHKSVLDNVERATKRLIHEQPRQEIIAESFKNKNSFFVHEEKGLEDILMYINMSAPEHLQLVVKHATSIAKRVLNAGAIFIGSYTPEAFGDYCAGPNHTLPTAGAARFSSPLGVYDFQKRTSIIECTEEGAQPLAEIASILAESESLYAHAQSARLRLKESS